MLEIIRCFRLLSITSGTNKLAVPTLQPLMEIHFSNRCCVGNYDVLRGKCLSSESAHAARRRTLLRSGWVFYCFLRLVHISRTQLTWPAVTSLYMYLPILWLVHGQVTIIFVVSVCLSVCLCRVFLSRLWSDFDQTRTHVICLGLVVSPRI